MKEKILPRRPLGNSRFHWRQKDFILSTFTCAGTDMEKAIQNCVEVGFNTVELGWASHEKSWQAVELCEKYGLDLIFQDLSMLGGMMGKHLNRTVSDDTILSVADQLRDKKHTIGYYVWDEPWREDMIQEARRQSDLLKSRDPGALLYSVFPPSYNRPTPMDTGEYERAFRKYIEQLSPPILSFDHYPIGDYFGDYPGFAYNDRRQLDDAVLWCDFTLARNLSNEYKLPFWFYYQGCKLFEVTQKLPFSMVRMMANAAVMYGAKGLQQYAGKRIGGEFLSGELVITFEGEKGEQFEEQKEFHAQIKNLGNTLMALHSEAVYHSEDVHPFGIYDEIYQKMANPIEDSKVLSGRLSDRTSVGELRDDFSNQYLFVLNRDFYQTASVALSFKQRFHVYEVSKDDGRQYLKAQDARTVQLILEPGDAVLLRVQPAGEESYGVTYQLIEE